LTQTDEETIFNISGVEVECELPNEFLHKFEGCLKRDQNNVPINLDQMLFRGSSLRNTQFIYGVVVFTGHETKIMKNSVNSRTKLSKLEVATNIYILTIVGLQVLFCLFAACYTSIWQNIREFDVNYLDYDLARKVWDDSLALLILVNFGRWFLIMM